MSNIIPMNYDDRSFPFTADCWFNATVAAKHHGKLPKDWLKTEATKIYIAELAEELGIASSGVKEDFSPLLVRVEKGRNGGTWLHPELAVEFARWLSVKFARACDRHIKNLLLSKNFQLTEDQIVGLMVCQQPTSWEKRFKDPFYQALSKMSGLPYFGHVGGCPALFFYAGASCYCGFPSAHRQKGCPAGSSIVTKSSPPNCASAFTAPNASACATASARSGT